MQSKAFNVETKKVKMREKKDVITAVANHYFERLLVSL